MLYVQIKERAVKNPEEELTVGSVALVTDEKGVYSKEAAKLTLPCPKNEGVWTLPAISIVSALAPLKTQLSVIGEAQCYVHIVPTAKRNKTHILRASAAFILLFLGSALAITWFHADVNMALAQRALFEFLSGREPASDLLLTIPYAVGVGLGVAFFYSLIGHKKTVSPLDIQLDQYRKDAEETAGEIP